MALRNPENFRTITNCYSTQADGITKTGYYHVKKKNLQLQPVFIMAYNWIAL